MFEDLRRKFIKTYFFTTLIVILGIFGVIYLAVMVDIAMRQSSKLSILLNSKDLLLLTHQPDITTSPLQLSEKLNLIENQQTQIETSHAFVVEINSQGQVTQIIDPTPGFFLENYQDLVTAALNQSTAGKRLNHHPFVWQFAQKTISPDEILIAFLDVSESESFLVSFLLTLIITGLILLMIVTGIIIHFVHLTLQPVATAWHQQKQFLSDISHELKTPLAIMTSNLDILSSHPQATIISQKQWLANLKVGLERMGALINDILQLSRLERGDLKVKMWRFNLSEEFEVAAKTIRPHLKRKQLRLKASIVPDISIVSNYDLIYQLLAILASNAVKYTPKRGYIEISLRKQNKFALAKVTNSGPGVKKEDLSKIFNRFYRVDGRSQPGETQSFGLGLAIAKTIIHKLGGEISVTSTEGKKTTFTFRLPLAQAGKK
jgi:signal transduction histidine kinase